MNRHYRQTVWNDGDFSGQERGEVREYSTAA